MKIIEFHPSALEFIQNLKKELKKEIGEALLDIQRGLIPGLPLSRPMPVIAPGTHELRLKDSENNVRVFFFVKQKDRILVFHAFQKKTQKTSTKDLELGKSRLKEILNENQTKKSQKFL